MVKRAENEVGKTKSICARIKHLNLSTSGCYIQMKNMNCSQWPQYLHFLPLSDSHVFGQKEFFEIRDKQKFRLWKLNFRLILQANFFSTNQRIFHLSWLHAQTDNSEHQLKKWNESSQFISYWWTQGKKSWRFSYTASYTTVETVSFPSLEKSK